MGFKRDLAAGKNGEEIVKKTLEKFGVTVEFPETREVDLVCQFGKKKFTAEIKNDMYAEKSGNVAFEYWNSKSDTASGITSTKATVWFHIIPDLSLKTLWATSVKLLRNYIQDNKPFRSIKKVGDGNADIHLYKMDQILEDIFHRLDNITSEDFKKIFKEIIKVK